MITPIELGTCGKTEPRPLLCYLIKTDGANVLVNTGVGTDNALIEQTHAPVVTEFTAALKAQTGLAPEQIDIVINTSLSFDHCGNNPLFDRPPVYIQTPEYDAAMSSSVNADTGDGNSTPGNWFNPMVVHYQQLNGDYQVTDHIRVLATPGFTSGQQSVLVETDTGSQLIVGHAIEDLAEFEQHRIQPVPRRDAADEAQYLASVKRLLELELSKVWFCHGAAAWVAGN